MKKIESQVSVFQVYSIAMGNTIENYRYMLLTISACRHMSDIRPDMRQRTLLVTSRAAWRRNRMHLARQNVDCPLAAIIVETDHKARCASGPQPPRVDNGTGRRLSPVPVAWSMPAHPETFADQAAFNISNCI